VPVHVEPWAVVLDAQLEVPSVGLAMAEQVLGAGHDQADPDQTPFEHVLVAVDPVPHKQEAEQVPP